MERVVFIANHLHIAEGWAKRWGYNKRDVIIPFDMRDVVGISGEISMYLCGPPAEPYPGDWMLDVLEHLAKQGADFINAQEDTGVCEIPAEKAEGTTRVMAALISCPPRAGDADSRGILNMDWIEVSVMNMDVART